MDSVFPNNNENEFIRIAERLNLEGLCFIYEKPQDISRVQQQTTLKLSTAIICKPEDVRKYKGRFTTIVRAPDDQTRIRHIIEQIRPDILIDLEFARRKDFMHHRASGLNHILAQLAADKGVTIGFNFSRILEARPNDRAVYIGRMRQNLGFARKFKFQMIFASFANHPREVRPRGDMISFFASLGLKTVENASIIQGVEK